MPQSFCLVDAKQLNLTNPLSPGSDRVSLLEEMLGPKIFHATMKLQGVRNVSFSEKFASVTKWMMTYGAEHKNLVVINISDYSRHENVYNENVIGRRTRHQKDGKCDFVVKYIKWAVGQPNSS